MWLCNRKLAYYPIVLRRDWNCFEPQGLEYEGKLALDAPAVFFGVLEGALHFLMQNFQERGSAHRLCAGFADVRGAIAAAQDTHQRLFHPVSFEAQAKRIAKHHRGAEDRADGIGRVFPGKCRRRSVNGLEERRAGSKAGRFSGWTYGDPAAAPAGAG